MNTTAASPSTVPWRFLLAAFAGSWAAWGLVAVAGAALPRPATALLLMAGFAVVGACAIVAVHAGRDGRAAGAFWSSVRDFHRIPVVGWLAALLLAPALTLLAAAIDAFATNSALTPGALPQALDRPLALLRTFGFSLLVGPFLEELGWRGVALRPLQRRCGPLAGAVLLGGIHALWHLPLFIAPAGYFHALGLLTPAFWRFMADIVVFDVLAAAIFNVARCSTLAAIVFHVSFNAAAVLCVLAPAAEGYRDLMVAAAAAGVLIATRGRLFFGGEEPAGAPRPV